MQQRDEMLDVTDLEAKLQLMIFGPRGPATEKPANKVAKHFEGIAASRLIWPTDIAPLAIVSFKMLYRLIGVQDNTGNYWFNSIPRSAAEKIACLFQFSLEWEEWKTGSVKEFAERYDREHSSGKILDGVPRGVWPGYVELGEAKLSSNVDNELAVTVSAILRGNKVREKETDKTVGFSMAYLDVLVTPKNEALMLQHDMPAASNPNVRVTPLHKVTNGRARALVFEVDAASQPIIECDLKSVAVLGGVSARDTAIAILIVPARKFIFGSDQSDNATDDRKVVQLTKGEFKKLESAAAFSQIKELRVLPSIWVTKSEELIARHSILGKLEAGYEGHVPDDLTEEKIRNRKKNRDGCYVVSWHALPIGEVAV